MVYDAGQVATGEKVTCKQCGETLQPAQGQGKPECRVIKRGGG